MDGTKIDWADSTWNPVTGCLHGCGYCYAMGIAKRYGCKGFPLLENGDCAVCYKDYKFSTLGAGEIHLFELDKPLYQKTEGGKIVKAPYPFQFRPTFHRYRLDEYAKKERPRDIFVCSMADLFGEWVPDSWIQEVFDACRRGTQHRYMFLTKNPGRFIGTMAPWKQKITDNMWFGFSAANQSQINDMAMGAMWMPKNLFISIEPIHGPIDLHRVEPTGKDAFLDFITGQRSWLMGGDMAGPKLIWVIIGAETGNRKGKVIPEREWIMSIKRQCQEAGAPVFMKESLRELMGSEFVQDKPW